MNDVGYLDLPFKESEVENSILYRINDFEQLNLYKRHIEMAVDFHTEENNPKQVAFFQTALDMCIKKQNKLMRMNIK